MNKALFCTEVFTLLLLGLVDNSLGGSFVNRLWVEPGDIYLGYVVSAHDANESESNSQYSPDYACGGLTPSSALLITAFRKLIKDINSESRFNGFKLGFEIVDTCKSPAHAVDLATPWAVNKVLRLSSPRSATPPPIAVIGGYHSRVTAPLAVMLQQFDIPLIDFASTSTDLSDRRRYPLFARTSPSDKHQAVAIAILAAKLGYQCVHLVFSSGLYGELGANRVSDKLKSLGVSVASSNKAPAIDNSAASRTFDSVISNIGKHSSAKAIICFCEDTTARLLLEGLDRAGTTGMKIIASDSWGTGMDLRGIENPAEGAITVSLGASTSSQFDPGYLTQLARQKDDHDPYFAEFLEQKFTCTFQHEKVNRITKLCQPEWFALSSSDLPENTYLGSMKEATYAVASGIDRLIDFACSSIPRTSDCLDKINMGAMPAELYGLIIQSTQNSQPVFDRNADGLANYEFNWFSRNHSGNGYKVVGSWKGNSNLETNAEFARIPKTTSIC